MLLQPFFPSCSMFRVCTMCTQAFQRDPPSDPPLGKRVHMRLTKYPCPCGLFFSIKSFFCDPADCGCFFTKSLTSLGTFATSSFRILNTVASARSQSVLTNCSGHCFVVLFPPIFFGRHSSPVLLSLCSILQFPPRPSLPAPALQLLFFSLECFADGLKVPCAQSVSSVKLCTLRASRSPPHLFSDPPVPPTLPVYEHLPNGCRSTAKWESHCIRILPYHPLHISFLITYQAFRQRTVRTRPPPTASATPN